VQPEGAGHTLLELAARLKLRNRSVPRLWVSGPTLLLAVSSALWSSRAWSGFEAEATDPTSTSFAFLQSDQPMVLVGSRRAGRADSSLGLCVPTAHVRSEGPLVRQFSKLPLFRLQGLATLVTDCSLRIPADGQAARSALGIRPFEAPALQGVTAFSQ